ncbi:MAG: hypothetical protein SNJ56_04310 [Termitinemataceae bacterium]
MFTQYTSIVLFLQKCYGYLRMKIITVAIIASSLFMSCDLFRMDNKVVLEQNAVWSEEENIALIIQSHYTTKFPELPFYNIENKASNWQVVLQELDATTNTRKELYRWNDERGDASQGWIQTTSVYYRKGNNKVYYPEGNKGVIRDLRASTYKKLLLPKDKIIEYFTYNGTPLYEGDVTVPVIEVLPSPDGTLVTVLYQVYVLNSSVGGFYISAIGIFTETGSMIGSFPLSEWNGTDIYLGTYFADQTYTNLLNSGIYNGVPTANSYSMFWKDSNTCYITNREFSENQKKAAFKINIDINQTLSLTSSWEDNLNELTDIDNLSNHPKIPTTGTYQNTLGQKFLFYTQDSANPNKSSILIRNR